MCEPSWYALQVQPNHEGSVAGQLRGKGYSEYLPCFRAPAGMSGKKVSARPLFPGYVFCRFDPIGRDTVGAGRIVTTPGVIRIVGAGRTPLAIPDEEIEGIRCVLSSNLHNELWPFTSAGELVEIHAGPLRGICGRILRSGGAERLVLSVQLLQRSLAVTIVREWARPVATSSHLLAARTSNDCPTLENARHF